MSGHPQQRDSGTMVAFCKMGQSTVQEIVIKTSDLFSLLKTFQLPNGHNHTPQAYREKEDKLKDNIKNITGLFKSLKMTYDKCNQITNQLDHNIPEDYVPWTDGPDNRQMLVASMYRERARMLTEEKRDLQEKVRFKNRQLKQVMELLRALIWDINTMMAMRHSHPS